jgi:hypothetical protein
MDLWVKWEIRIVKEKQELEVKMKNYARNILD